MAIELIQYLAKFMPLALIQCDGCTREIEISKAVERDNRFFHSEQCAQKAMAPMVKPQPRRIEGVNYVDGWDV